MSFEAHKRSLLLSQVDWGEPVPPAPLSIPATLHNITVDWLASLVRHINRIPLNINMRVKSVNIAAQPNMEGCLSDICKAYIHIAVPDRKPLIHSFFIKIVPRQLREMVMRHRLFDREILFYRFILPQMRAWARDQNPDIKFNFSVPKFVYGDVDETGAGVVVMEDLSSKGFRTVDPQMLLLDMDHMTVAVRDLAEFHALTIAFDLCSGVKLEKRYPLINPEKVMWFQDDMSGFLQEMFQTSHTFLQSLPGEEEIARRFAARLSDPMQLFKSDLGVKSVFSCLQHGDTWHNNLLFHSTRTNIKMALVDWQVAYLGRGPSDLCYLVYSTTTAMFRQKHLATLLNLYFSTLMATVRSLGVPEKTFSPTMAQFQQEFTACLPLCLFFCGNVEDLTLRPEEDEIHEMPKINAKMREGQSPSNPRHLKTNEKHSPKEQQRNSLSRTKEKGSISRTKSLDQVLDKAKQWLISDPLSRTKSYDQGIEDNNDPRMTNTPISKIKSSTLVSPAGSSYSLLGSVTCVHPAGSSHPPGVGSSCNVQRGSPTSVQTVVSCHPHLVGSSCNIQRGSLGSTTSVQPGHPPGVGSACNVQRGSLGSATSIQPMGTCLPPGVGSSCNVHRGSPTGIHLCVSPPGNSPTGSSMGKSLIGSPQGTSPVGSIQGNQIIRSSPSSQPGGPASGLLPSGQPVGSSTGSLIIGSIQVGQPIGSIQGGQPIGSFQGGHPTGSIQGQGGQPIGSVQGGHPIGSVQGGQPIGSVQGGQPIGSVQGGHPIGSVQGGHPIGSVQGGQPIGSVQGQGGQPIGSIHSQGGQPIGTVQAGYPIGSVQGGQPIGSVQGGHPIGSVQGGHPIGSVQGQGGQPIGSTAHGLLTTGSTISNCNKRPNIPNSSRLSAAYDIASDQEMKSLEERGIMRSLDQRKARALRRKHYLDICREAVYKGVL